MQRWPLNRQRYTLPATSETDLGRQEEVIRLKEPDDGARFWEQSLPTYVPEKEKCNLQVGRTRREEDDRSGSETGFCKARVKQR